MRQNHDEPDRENEYFEKENEGREGHADAVTPNSAEVVFSHFSQNEEGKGDYEDAEEDEEETDEHSETARDVEEGEDFEQDSEDGVG